MTVSVPTASVLGASAYLGTAASGNSTLSAGPSVHDLAALEVSLREAIGCVASEAAVESTVRKVRELFLYDLAAAAC